MRLDFHGISTDSLRELPKCIYPYFSLGNHVLIDDRSFANFEEHLRTNTVGPIIVAQKLLQISIPIGTIIFMSSDSGSTAEFRAFEDGYGEQSFEWLHVLNCHHRFAAYAASKAALNQMLRHMAVELQRKKTRTSILAMHPGEVAT